MFHGTQLFINIFRRAHGLSQSWATRQTSYSHQEMLQTPALEDQKLENFNKFKKEVKAMSLNNSFYTLKEFLQAKLM